MKRIKKIGHKIELLADSFSLIEYKVSAIIFSNPLQAFDYQNQFVTYKLIY
jgi:hypothetical protein